MPCCQGNPGVISKKVYKTHCTLHSVSYYAPGGDNYSENICGCSKRSRVIMLPRSYAGEIETSVPSISRIISPKKRPLLLHTKEQKLVTLLNVMNDILVPGTCCIATSRSGTRFRSSGGKKRLEKEHDVGTKSPPLS